MPYLCPICKFYHVTIEAVQKCGVEFVNCQPPKPYVSLQPAAATVKGKKHSLESSRQNHRFFFSASVKPKAPYLERDYACPEIHCGKRFTQNYLLEEHINQAHCDERNFPCTICDSAFKIKKYLLEHVRKVHSTRIYECDFCGYKFKVKAILAKHLRQHLGIVTAPKPPKALHSTKNTLECDKCKITFRDRGELKLHKQKYPHNVQYFCSKCDEIFWIKLEWLEHEAAHNFEQKYECRKCGAAFAYLESFAEHKNMHAKEIKMKQKAKEKAQTGECT